MIGYRVRYEQGRGHRMVLEGEPPIAAAELDEIQLKMLANCDVPGLLKLETEELDGCVALRYALTGRRMLSQSFRAARWTMEDAMTALCRLAEILERGREYMLDLERYVLEDDYIFVGEGWHDLSFTYLPLWRQTASAPIASGLEKLIVRWMMNVELPDGLTMQRLLRLASSPDFSPALLRRYARQYFGESALGTGAEAARYGGDRTAESAASVRWKEPDSPLPSASFSAADSAAPYAADPAAAAAAAADKQEQTAWGRWLAPQEEPHSLSDRLGESPPSWSGATADDSDDGGGPSRERLNRHRIAVAAGGAIAAAAIWRFAYLPFPGRKGLLAAAGLTLLAFGVCACLWNGGSRKGPPRSGHGQLRREPGGERMPSGSPGPASRAEPEAGAKPAEPPKPRRFDSLAEEGRRRGERTGAEAESPIAMRPFSPTGGDAGAASAQTSWLPAGSEGTQLLASTPQGRRVAEPYLEWDADGTKTKIRLVGDSFVIGRYPEAVQHIDETQGVSRAHLELVRGEGAWQAKDLGSKNGSWLNGVPMAPYEPYPLSRGDSIQIASSLYRYQAE